ncbi:DNA polymerase IV [Streptomyces sp. NBC_01317]|uniref:DNA polymerase IV n=1 Tax=Streptomyces sp. NBC_01317 TaxID=2903822 RepID=UPI002E13625B|nr:DNA polymerase IV [Streptomyces sp. NBC_01317]
MRAAPTVLHLDMDAFFAAAEQAAKPSLRGKPVVVGGLGPRGVVSTASYEARRYGVHSAMPMAQARRLAPNAAYLVPRFTVYRAISEQVMELLGRLSPLVEPLSLDEAFVDLEAGGSAHDTASARAAGERLRRDIRATTGLTGSVGLAGSKMLAKIASEQAKPDGLVIVEPGTERALLGPMTVRTLPGVGPATGEHLRRAGMTTVADLAEAGEDELVRLLGKSHGASLFRMAGGHDDRPVVAERETKSVSVEDTFDVDLHDRVRVRSEVDRLADRCVQRLRAAGHSGRTVVLKVRRYDFSTLTRSETLRGPTDDPGVVREAAGRLLESVDTTGGVRLLGVGVSGLADYTQEDLFAQAAADRLAADRAVEAAAQVAVPPVAPEEGSEKGPEKAGEERAGPSRALGAAEGHAAPTGGVPAAQEASETADLPAERRFPAGHDVHHAVFGAGWVQGSGLRRVTVRFEEPWSAPGRVRTFWVDDPELELSDPLPLTGGPAQDGAEATRRGPEPAGDGPGPPERDQSSWPATRPKSRSASRSDSEAGRSGGPGSGRARP